MTLNRLVALGFTRPDVTSTLVATEELRVAKDSVLVTTSRPAMGHMATRSYLEGRKVTWDAKLRRIV